MEENGNFRDRLEEAITQYRDNLEHNELTKLKEAARNYFASYQAFYNVLLRKSLVHEDPYKNDIKISEVEAPESGPLVESEKVDKMSQRLSMLESQLDFLNNYYQFACDFLTMPRIKRIKELITYIRWDNLSVSASNMNTKIVAELLGRMRQGSDPISSGVINDSVQQMDRATKQILSVLKKLTIYQRERYKLELRHNLLDTMELKADAIRERREEVAKAIKRKFPQVLGDTPFFPELIEEILDEEAAYDADSRRAQLLEKLQVRQEKQNNQAQKSFKPYLLDGCRILSSAATPLEQALRKLLHNAMVLQDRPVSMGERFKNWIRSMIVKEEEKRFYEVELFDPATGASKMVKLDFDQFIDDSQKLARMLVVIGNKMSTTYKRLEGFSEEQLFEFLSGKIEELNKVHQKLPPLDTYFKSEVSRVQRQMIRGVKIEVTAIKNAMVKANQKRHEYVSQKEEIEQLKKLGVQPGQ
jgi:hypothetical protein